MGDPNPAPSPTRVPFGLPAPSGGRPDGSSDGYGPPRERYWLHVVLLAATILTTTIVGGEHWLAFKSDFGTREIPTTPAMFLLRGLWYALTVLAILGAHELGHYLACRYYRISATLPYFLPIPFPLTGTAGAFIRIRQPIVSKASLFDIGVAGPFAGFLIAVPALLIGMTLSTLVPLPPDFSGLELGEPLLLKAAEWLVFGSVPDELSVNLHPMAFAAWFGLLATALNLFPIGQFDGGHISYAVFGPRALYVTIATVAIAVGLCFYSSSWIVWTALAVGLLTRFGWRHPPTWDDHVPLDRTRRWVALGALLVFLLCFTPVPIQPLDLIRP